MKITRVRTWPVASGFRNWLYTTIETDEGIVGLSEVTCKRHTRTVEAGIHEAARYLTGKDPRRIEDHFEKMYRDAFWCGGPIHVTALSALETALWDIQGKRLGVPIYELLGGPTRDRVPCYCHCHGGKSPEEFVANARQCVDRGFRVIKTGMPLHYGATPPKTEGVGSDKPLGYFGTPGTIGPRHKETEFLSRGVFANMRRWFEALRDALGDDVDFAVDCHGRLSVAQAIDLADTLADLRPLFIEEPVPPDNIDAYVAVTRKSRVPIASGERWVTIYGVREVVARQAVHVLQPDVCNCGGFAAGKKIAALAEAWYIPIALHNPNGPVATAMSVHLAAAIPNFYLLETVGTPDEAERHQAVCPNALQIANGAIPIPTGPGLGVDVPIENLEAGEYRPFDATR